MDKKGQATIFIIIGLVLLIIAGFLFYFTQYEREIEVPVEVQPLKLYVESCLETTAVNGIVLAGLQGGYTDAPPSALETDYSLIAYHYSNGDVLTPSRGTIESQISSFVENSLNVCLGNFSPFKEQGYEVATGDISANTIIRENDVFVRIEYPIELSDIDSKVELDEYSAIAPVRLGHVHEISRLVTAKTAESPEWVDLTFLSGFDVKIDALPHDEERFVYSIKDEKSLIDGEPFVFLLANSFTVNQPPVLDIPGTLILEDNKPVILQLNATDPEDDPLTFSDDTSMFDVTEDGVVLFTPEITGEFDVTITVTDTHENLVSRTMKIIVEE